MRGGSGGGGGGRGTCAARLSVAFFVLGRVSERNSIGTLIDGSDSDLNWLFSAPITGWGIRGESRAGRPRCPIAAEIPFDPKIGRESRREWGLEWIGAFLWLTLASRRVTSNQIFQVRTTTTTTRRPWQIAIRWPFPVAASAAEETSISS